MAGLQPQNVKALKDRVEDLISQLEISEVEPIKTTAGLQKTKERIKIERVTRMKFLKSNSIKIDSQQAENQALKA